MADRPYRRALAAAAPPAVGAAALVALLDVALAARGAAAPGAALARALLVAAGLYAAAALALAAGEALVVGAFAATTPLAERLRALARDVRHQRATDRAVAAALGAALVAALVQVGGAAAFALLSAQHMANRALGALSVALVAGAAAPLALAAALPAYRLLRRLTGALPLPPPMATATIAGGAGLGLAGLGALVLSRIDWRVLRFGPALAAAGLLALQLGLVAVAARRRGPASAPSGRLALGVAAAAVALLAGALRVDDPVALELVTGRTAGARLLAGAARALADRDHDGYAALLGGGDCDDRRPDVHPGAPDRPGDGIDQNCLGGDARRRGAPARPSTRPRPGFTFDGNLLVITIDTLRADRLGVAGYGRPLTPNLDRLAREGIWFSHAYAQAPNTPRSFPSLVTSRYPSRVRWRERNANFSPILDDNETLFEALARAGLRNVGLFSHFYFTPERGISQGFAEWDNAGALSLHDSNTDVAAPRIAPRVTSRLAGLARERRRFALWTHFFEPHSRYMEHPEVLPVHGRGTAALVDKYDAEIAYVDRYVGQVLDALAASGLAARTAVALFSDHGEAFGEHGLYFHGQTLYDELLRVPLIFRVPGLAPRRVDAPVALLDLAPTLVELAGGVPPASFQGRSLLPALLGQPLSPRPVGAELLTAPSWPHEAKALVDGDQKVIYRISDNAFELYDVRADPGERVNLAAGAAARLAGGKARMLRWMEEELSEEGEAP